jgi:transposase
VHPNAAGIDIGATSHFVAVPEDRSTPCVRQFSTFTADLHQLADWLQDCGIETVAMESTGVYWIAVFQILEKRGFEVKLVNARHIKNVPGRKTDVVDCQWIQQLHSYGLLSASFRPENEICVLRSYVRQRDSLVKDDTTHVLRMQKALTQMNVQLHHVISDITGLTGIRIIEAILAGERDPTVLAAMKDGRIKSSHQTIAKALEGDYREEHLFALQQEFELHKLCQAKIAQCEERIVQQLATFEDKVDLDAKPLGPAPQRRRKTSDKTRRHRDLRKHLYRMTGIDLTRIDGFDVLTVQAILSEVGVDMSKWPTERHFCSWLTLCPNNKITGGQVKSTRTRRSASRAAQAFRLAAQSLKRSQTALGAFYRRMNARLDTPKAITATAHKLARIFYRLLKFGQAYVDPGMAYYETKYRLRVVANLKKRAAHLGYELTEKQPLAQTVS